MLFRDLTEALPGELSIVYPLAGAQADTEGIVVFKKGPAIDRALTALFSCPSEGREEDPPTGSGSAAEIRRYPLLASDSSHATSTPVCQQRLRTFRPDAGSVDLAQGQGQALASSSADLGGREAAAANPDEGS